MRTHFRQQMYGYTEAVTFLAASAGYYILVSGWRDRTAIVWDLSRLAFIRQLTGHNAPLAAIDINDLTGDIATCSGTWLHLWSINGDPLASVNTLVGQIGRSQHILCVCFSQFNEWDPMNVILTGSTDGVVRMWSLDFVQVLKLVQIFCLLILNLLFEFCRFLMRKHPHKWGSKKLPKLQNSLRNR